MVPTPGRLWHVPGGALLQGLLQLGNLKGSHMEPFVFHYVMLL